MYNKQAILKIVAKLFKEKGFFNTSIQDISKAVGLKGGSLYYHIKSKENALLEICFPALNEALDVLEETAYLEHEPEEKLRKMIGDQIQYFLEHFNETCVFLLEVKSLGEEYQKVFIANRDKFEKHIRDVIQEGMRKGVFRKGDAKLMTFGILGMLNWMVIWFKPEGKWKIEKIRKEFTEMILRGLKN